MFNKNLVLSNGVKIPQIGLGTRLIDNDKVSEVVKKALQLGYRHIDTAQAYNNEEGVGKGIKESEVAREEIFLQTKLAAEIKTYDEAIKAIEGSLKRLNVDYIDLMIIHSPDPWNDYKNGNNYDKGNLEAWRALEKFYLEGKIKAIGVSNFEISDLENIINNAKIKPMVNQIICHISNTNFELIDFCKKNNIVVEAHSPIGHGELLKNDDVLKIASKYHVSIPQLAIRYLLDLGIVALPKASSYEHLKENLNIEFTISKEDFSILKNFSPITSYGENDCFPVYGVFNRKNK